MIEQHVAALQTLLSLDQTILLRDRELTNEQAHATMVAGILMRGGAKLDSAASDALTEDYLDAIEDLPAWAVREAIRKWNRGESVRLDNKPHDFNWRPAPATLARLARLERWIVQGRIVTLQDLLGAQPMIEYSPEHRADMLGKLSKVMHSVTATRAPDAAAMQRAKRLGREADRLAQAALDAEAAE